MSNPWLKKNPFMSMWLSGANRVAGSVRGQAAAAAKRESAAVARQAGNEWMKLWTGALAAPAAAPAKKRNKARK